MNNPAPGHVRDDAAPLPKSGSFSQPWP